MHELELVEYLKTGDVAAFRELVELYQPMVLNCCFRFVQDRESAEDLTQEVFIEVHRSVRGFRAESKLSTWLYRIATTKSLDHLKAQNRAKRFAFLRSLLPGEEQAESTIPSDLPDPHEVLEQEERRQVLARAVRTLPRNQQIAFTLSTTDDLSYEEIAGVLGTTIPAVESLLFRARTNLRKRLYRYYHDQTGGTHA